MPGGGIVSAGLDRVRNHSARLLIVLSAAALVVACGRINVADHLKKGDAYFAQSQYAEAAIEYRVALSGDLKRGDIHEKLGDTMMHQKDLPGALKEYARAADLLPNDAAAQINAGNLLLLAHSFEDAKSRADKALAIDPKNALALVLKGDALAGLKDFDSALDEFQQALVLDPTQDAAQRNIGVIQLSKGHPAEAEAAYRKAVAIAPKSVQANLALAGFLWRSGRSADAEQALKATIALDPANGQANRALGMFYIASGRATEAEPYFRELAKTSKTNNDVLALADYYVTVNRLDDATKTLSDLARNKPDAAAAANTRLAAIDVLRGDRAAGMAKARALVQDNPKEMPARLLIARLQVMDAKWTDALATTKGIVNDDPNSSVAGLAYQLQGDIQAQLDRPADAVLAYQEVLKRNPKAIQAMLGLAAVDMTIGNIDTAATYARQALTLAPKNPLARILVARAHVAKNDPGAAAEIVALEKDYPRLPNVYDLAAVQALHDRHIDAARTAYTKALALSPGNLEALRGLAQIDRSTGHAQDAVARIDDALKSQKPSSELWILAASTYASAGDRDRTEQALKHAIEANPSRLQPYLLLGELYIGEKRLDDAHDQFAAWVARDPRSVAANTMLGMLLEMQRRPADAEKQYEQAVAGGGSAAVAANNLAWIYVSSNRNLEQALQLAQSAVRDDPSEPHFQDTLGWILYRQNDARQAIEHLEASVKGLPKDADGHYHLGMAYLMDGQLEQAKTELSQALTLNPNFDNAAETHKVLAGMGG
jgi:tetratricopeptide (TPR) repeat protein